MNSDDLMAVSRSSSLRQHRYAQKVGSRRRTFHHSLLEHSAEQHCAIALRRGGLPRISLSCRGCCLSPKGFGMNDHIDEWIEGLLAELKAFSISPQEPGKPAH